MNIFERIFEKIWPDDGHYTFVAEEKHTKYGLHVGCTYRAKQEPNDSGRLITTSKPVLLYDPAYDTGPMWRYMIPFTRVPEFFLVDDDKTGQKTRVRNNSQGSVYVIDTIIAMGVLALFAIAVILATVS